MTWCLAALIIWFVYSFPVWLRCQGVCLRASSHALALLSCPHSDSAFPDSCLVPQPHCLAAWQPGSQPVAWSSLHWPSLKLLIEGCMSLQKLGLKTLRVPPHPAPGGRYLKADRVGQSWSGSERENPPSWVEQGVVGTKGGLIPTWCVTGLQGSSAVLAPSNPRSVLSQTSLT